jgi:hypothetical protein
MNRTITFDTLITTYAQQLADLVGDSTSGVTSRHGLLCLVQAAADSVRSGTTKELQEGCAAFDTAADALINALRGEPGCRNLRLAAADAALREARDLLTPPATSQPGPSHAFPLPPI